MDSFTASLTHAAQVDSFSPTLNGLLASALEQAPTKCEPQTEHKNLASQTPRPRDQVPAVTYRLNG